MFESGTDHCGIDSMLRNVTGSQGRYAFTAAGAYKHIQGIEILNEI